MRESFVFYRSFFDAICKLDDKKRLKMYDLISSFALNCEEIEPKYEICEQLFILIKPQLIASHKHYDDGKKGGRPKKIKNPPFEKIKSNENDNVNENENDNVNENVINPDLFFDNNIRKCFEIYEKECPNLISLTYEKKHRKTLTLLAEVLDAIDNDIGKFTELCEKANAQVKIADTKLDFKMMLNCYIGLLQDKYKEKDMFEGIDFNG